MSTRHKKNKKIKLIAIILILVIAAGTASYFTFGKEMLSKVADGKKKTTDNSKNKGKKKVEEPKLQVVNTDSKTRPFAVMINNIGVARPVQCGLQDAYLVYEIIVEGGITRFMALFEGDKDVSCIGSIRSARHYYLDYALENDAIYVHHGYSPQAGEDFSNLNVDHISSSEPNTGWREKGLGVSTEHTLFSSTEKLKKGIGKKRTEYSEERYKDNYGLLLHYSVKTLDLASIANSQVANKVSIRYSNSNTSSYEYDAEAKVYKRFVNGKVHKDRVTGKQFTFKNIITYQVKNYNLNDGSGKGRQGLNNVGSGTGYYISEGYAIPIKWKKDSRKSKTIYTLEDGSELKVNDGNTFIQIQPTGNKLEITE
ncbi:MAG: DUF3048 domain-containing protein [Bacilli bacterium]|nr:DUF3048 domain-containing protein [Bacilli bacterium]